MLGNPTFISDDEYKMVMRNRAVKNNPDYVLMEFDNNMQMIMDNGYTMIDRTGVGVKYLPGITTKIDISERVPVSTRRKTSWKSMLKEYLWFLTGSDRIGDLNAMGSKVWDFWKDEEWATKHGFSPDSIGYGYGPNLIHSGGDLHDLKNNPGVNQMDYVINELKNNPYSRRILIDFWRADKLSQQKLPSCHTIYQWIVSPNEKGEMKDLHCVMYQRSCDSVVGGLSTNLQGATFYTYMLAQQVGMTPKTLTHQIGHAHIYLNHIEPLKEYLSRPIPKSPKLILHKKDSIYDYTADDFELVEYEPLPAIKFEIAV
jgi:thymidylate synthase